MDNDELLRIIEKAATDGVTLLDLSNKGLTELPPEIGMLTNLTRLYLRYNQLVMFPPEIGQLTTLKELDLAGNQLSMLPYEIWRLINLIRLNLRYNQLSTLPPEIGNLTSLKELELRVNQLTTLPSEIGNLLNLTWLGLSDNHLCMLPPEIGQLKNLNHLFLGDNQLTTLPLEIEKLTNLIVLYLKGNPLPLPPEIIELIREPAKIIIYYLQHQTDLHETKTERIYVEQSDISVSDSELLKIIDQTVKKNIRSLDLSYKKLTRLPSEIGQLINLASLKLKGNQLTMLPPEIGQLATLEELDLSYNQLTMFPPEFAKLTNLRGLNLRYNRLTMLPPEIGQLKNLTRLGLSDNQLTILPPEIGQLKNLTKLYLPYNKLITLPQEIGELTNLTELELSENQITTFPREIVKLLNLTRFSIGNNQFSTLPPEIGRLTNLTSLSLRDSELTILPQEIRNLTHLTRLNLNNNRLTILPPEIGNFKNLTELILRGNQLNMLPQEINKLTNLRVLNLRDNPLPIPPEILELIHEPQKILNYYFQHQQEQKKPLNEAKAVIVGQGAVGKTSLVKRLLENKFDPYETKTEGIDIKQWNVTVPSTGSSTNSERMEVRLNVWDFGGQEIMHATHQFFLTKRSLYLLVLDSRLEEQENRVEYWLKIIQSFGGDSPIIVVCNKCDEHDLELNWKGLQEKYPTIKTFAKRVSCKTGEGISDLRTLIEREVGQLEHIHDELLLTWFAVKTRLEQMEEDYISYSEYQKMCEAENVSDELSQQTLLGFLHDLGIVLSFHGHYILEDTNVLNPEWVTRGIYQILNSNELFQRKGVLERKALDHILDSNEYLRSKHQFIIDMMRKFELCFDFAEPAGECFLVPDLLSKEEPYVGEWDDSLAFHYHYDILPGSVISRFIVRMHAYIFKNTYWRNGVVLVSEDGKNKALIKADIEDKKIFIYVSGRPETSGMFLAIIRADFHKIHTSISKLNVKEKVPVPGYPDVVVDYEHLVTLEELGEETFIPEGLRVKVDVKDLLHGVSGSASKKTDIGETPGVFKNSGSLRVGQQIEELQQRWNLLGEKLSKLEQTKILETKVDEKMRIEKLIEELTAERQQLGHQLNEVEAKLSSSK